MNAPTLIAVAHGSRDPRSPHVMGALADQVRGVLAAAPGPAPAVELAFLDLSAPSVTEMIARVAARGDRAAVAVPLLLGRAFHARTDLPGLLARARAEHPHLALAQAPVLGTGARLRAVLAARIAQAGIDPADPAVGIVLAAVGSSRADAEAATDRLGERMSAELGGRTVAVVRATGAPGQVTAAVARLRAAGARQIVIAPWFLAPGLLLDRVIDRVLTADPAAVVAAPLGATPILAELVIDRYRTAAAAITPATALPVAA